MLLQGKKHLECICAAELWLPSVFMGLQLNTWTGGPDSRIVRSETGGNSGSAATSKLVSFSLSPVRTFPKASSPKTSPPSSHWSFCSRPRTSPHLSSQSPPLVSPHTSPHHAAQSNQRSENNDRGETFRWLGLTPRKIRLMIISVSYQR